MKATLALGLAGLTGLAGAAANCNPPYAEAVPAAKDCTESIQALLDAKEKTDSGDIADIIATSSGCFNMVCRNHCHVQACTPSGAMFSKNDLLTDVNTILKECGADGDEPLKGESPEVEGRIVKISNPGEKCPVGMIA